MLRESVAVLHLKHSLRAAACLLLPIAALLFCHALVNAEAGLWWDPISESQFAGDYWNDEGVENRWMLFSGIVAVVGNALALLFIPALFGGMDKLAKHTQWLLGLLATSAAGIGFPFFYFFVYGLDNLSMWAALFPLHLLAFPITFVIASRFVTRAYKRAFWF